MIILATLGLGVAILTEAILSFLGLGMPPTQPSLGALIRVGNDLCFAIFYSTFPGLARAGLGSFLNTRRLAQGCPEPAPEIRGL